MANTKITSRVIADNAVTSSAIADGAITASKIASDAIDIVADTTPQLGGDLDVNGNAIAGSTVQINGAGGELMISATENGPVALRYDNNLKLTTKSDGVDITGELQSDSLDVDGDADISGTIALGNLTIAGAQGTDGQVLTSTGSGIAWEDAAGGGVDGIVSSADATAITIDSSENVGIGITNPSTRTHIYSSASSTPLIVESTSNTYVGIKNTTQTAYIGAVTSNMIFENNGSERMRINSDGNMHLGSADSDVQFFLGSAGGAFGQNATNNVRASDSNLMLNTPGQFIVEKSGSLGILMDTDKSFYVRPATSSDNFGMYVRTSNSADTGIKIGRTGTNNAEMGIKVASNGSNSFASFKFAISDGTSWTSDDWFKLKVSGEMDGNFNDTSDQNLKENIVSIPNGDLAKVMQLNPVTFDWKNAVSRNDQTGFIAQEVELIFPNEVLGDAYDVEVEGSGKSINTIGLLAHAVKAIQEQQTIIEDLQARIETLENS
jgi:hypothetical protein